MSETVVDFLVKPCGTCGKDISHLYALRKYCMECNEQRHAARDEEREENARITMGVTDYWLRIHNLSRAFSLFGKHDPLTELPHISIDKRKDRTAQALLSKDLPCPIRARKFSEPTLSDNEWDDKQRPFPHSLPMPRLLKTYCACCREAVIDGTREVRVTKGCYLPVDHECPRTRVYDIRGALLEVL